MSKKGSLDIHEFIDTRRQNKLLKKELQRAVQLKEGLAFDVRTLKNAIIDSESWINGYCIVCEFHFNNINGHGAFCPMKDIEEVS
jgi:hypothetical protein